MSTLTGQQIKDTYKSLLKVGDNGQITGTVKGITDGSGSASGLYLKNDGVLLSGSVIVSGSLNTTIGLTGSLQGTASWATNTISSSVATSASFASTASFVRNSISSSFATTASYALNAGQNPGGLDMQIQFKSASVFAGDSSFTYNYVSQSLRQGFLVTASGLYSHAEGGFNKAIGDFSHAEGGGYIKYYTVNTTNISSFDYGEGTSGDYYISNVVSSSITQIIAEGDYSSNPFPYTCSYFYIEDVNGNYAEANPIFYTSPIITNISYNSGSDQTTFTFSPALENSYNYYDVIINEAIGALSHVEGYRTSTAINTAYYAESVISGIVTLSSSYGDISHRYPNASKLHMYEVSPSFYYAQTVSRSYFDSTNTIIELTNSNFNLSNPTLVFNPLNLSLDGDQVFPGIYSHAEGIGTVAVDEASHAEGRNTRALGKAAHAEGDDTRAIGYFSHAEGESTRAIGDHSHAEGEGTRAIGNYSHAEGRFTQAVGNGSHAKGWFAVASGSLCSAEGFYTVAGTYSKTIGGYTNTYTSGISLKGVQLTIRSNDSALKSQILIIKGYNEGITQNGNFTAYYQPGDLILLNISFASSNDQLVIIQGTSVVGIVTATEHIIDQFNPFFDRTVLRFKVVYTSLPQYGNNVWETFTEDVINLTRPTPSGSATTGLDTMHSFVGGQNNKSKGPLNTVFGVNNEAIGANQFIVGRYNELNNSSSLFVVGGGVGTDNTGSRKDLFDVRTDNNNSGSMRIPWNTSSPSNPATSSMYHDPINNLLYLYNGTRWTSASLA